MNKAVVVLSGGMDSTTLLYMVRNASYDEISAVSFDYGQRHIKELQFASDVCAELDIVHRVVNLAGLNQLIQSSALTNPSMEIPEGHYADETMKATIVPNRNAMMLNIAAAHAVSIKARHIFVGMHAGDHPVYPDCRPEFVAKLNDLLRVANEGILAHDLEVRAPFINIEKSDIVKIGDDLRVPWYRTWSCYKGGAKHCGRCSTCVERIEAFHIAGVEDTASYVDRTFWKTVTSG